MPHYRDGQCAAIGDLVRGVGYNVKDANGKSKIIVGTVVGLTLGETCNIRVAFLSINEVPLLSRSITNGVHWSENATKYELIPVVEYGEAKEFELIEPVLVRAFIEADEQLVRPIMLANTIHQLCNGCTTYQLYQERNGELTPLGWVDSVEVKDGDRFYCVPPATGA